MGESLPLLPETLPDDHEDVVWGLQTATALWARGERREALVWVRRAAEAAGSVGADMRAVMLAKQAVSIEEYIGALEAAPPDPSAAGDAGVPRAAGAQVEITPQPPQIVSFPSVAPTPTIVEPTHIPVPPDAPTLKGTGYAPSSDFEADNIGDRMSAPLLTEEDEIRDDATIPRMDISGMRDLLAAAPPPPPAATQASRTEPSPDSRGPLSTPDPRLPAPPPTASSARDHSILMSVPQASETTPIPFRAAQIDPQIAEKDPARPVTKPPPPPVRTRSATLQPGVLLNPNAPPPTVSQAAAPASAPADAAPASPSSAAETPPPPTEGKELEKQRARKKQRAPILDPWADDLPEEPARFRVQHQVADTGPGSDDDVITSAALIDVTLRRKPPPPPARAKAPPAAPAEGAAHAPPASAPNEPDAGDAKSRNGEPARDTPARPPAPPPPRRTPTLTGQSIASLTGAAPASSAVTPAPAAARPPTLAPASAAKPAPPPGPAGAPAAAAAAPASTGPSESAGAKPPPAATAAPESTTESKRRETFTDAGPRSARATTDGPKSVRPPPAPPRREPSIAPPPPPPVAASVAAPAAAAPPAKASASAQAAPAAAAPPAPPAAATPAPPAASTPAPAAAVTPAPSAPAAAHAAPPAAAPNAAAGAAPTSAAAPHAVPPAAPTLPAAAAPPPAVEVAAPATTAAASAAASPAAAAPAAPTPAAAAATPATSGAAPAAKPASAGPPSSVPREVRTVAGLPLDRVDAFADLPGELQKELADSADVFELGPNDERQGFGVLVVISGVVDVCATIADIPAAMVAEGGVVPALTSIEDVVAVRAVATSNAKVATWTKAQIESALKACPWVLEELVRVGDRFAALAGATMGPLGDLDDESRRRTLDMFRIRALREHEVFATVGQDTPGLTLVGGGELVVGHGEERPVTLGSGEIVFPDTVLDGSPAPREVRAGEGGALLLTAARSTTIELFSTMPMLLELLR
ncbi:MAG: hypothetical protein U0414_41105 [Polyangiaceae bacterium]